MIYLFSVDSVHQVILREMSLMLRDNCTWLLFLYKVQAL